MPVLSKSFRIELLAGVSQTIIEKGTEIPASKSSYFSTVDDGQHAIEVHVLRGDAWDVARNESYAKYLIHQVPDGPRGTAKVEVRFEVDFHGNLTLRAFDQSTAQELPVRPR
jgi:molecular chaperone DnaK (HSP70)